MKLNQHIAYIYSRLRGRLPTTIFIWQFVLGSVCIISILLVSFWYYKFYSISYGNSSSEVAVEQYEKVIDIQKLDETLKLFDLKEVDKD